MRSRQARQTHQASQPTQSEPAVVMGFVIQCCHLGEPERRMITCSAAHFSAMRSLLVIMMLRSGA